MKKTKLFIDQLEDLGNAMEDFNKVIVSCLKEFLWFGNIMNKLEKMLKRKNNEQ